MTRSKRVAAVLVVVAAGMTATACGGGGDTPRTARKPSTHAGVQEIASIPLGREPGQLAVGFGSVWVVGLEGSLVRIKPGSNTVTARVKVSSAGGFLAVGQGGVWVPDYDGNKVHRIDPETNKVVAEIPVGAAPAGVRATPGAVWVANHHGGSVSRIDPKLNRVVATVRVGPRGTRGPKAVATGAGDVWVGVPNLNAVVRIDPTSNRVVARISMPPEVPPCGGLAADDEGVWVSAGGCNVGVARVDPATNKLADVLFEGEPLEYGVDIGQPTVAEGSVWFTKSTPKSVFLYEVEATTGKTVSKTNLRLGAGDLSFGFGSLWLGDWERKQVMRLEAK